MKHKILFMAIVTALIILTCSAFTPAGPPGDDSSLRYEQPSCAYEPEIATAICFEQSVLCNQTLALEEPTSFNHIIVPICGHFGLANAGKFSIALYEHQRQWDTPDTALRGMQTYSLQMSSGNMDHRIRSYIWSAPGHDNYESPSHYILEAGPKGGGDVPFNSFNNATHTESVRCPV